MVSSGSNRNLVTQVCVTNASSKVHGQVCHAWARSVEDIAGFQSSGVRKNQFSSIQNDLPCPPKAVIDRLIIRGIEGNTE